MSSLVFLFVVSATPTPGLNTSLNTLSLHGDLPISNTDLIKAERRSTHPVICSLVMPGPL